MNVLGIELAVVVVLVLLNGGLAMAEISLVSARRSFLKDLALRGDRRATAALELAESPHRFLATIQVGITLVGIVAGVFGGASLAAHLSPWIANVPALAAVSTQVALGLVVAGITFASLVFGELVPKRIGLSNPERIALLVATPVLWLSVAARPVVWFLGGFTEAIFRLIGGGLPPKATVSDDEVKGLMQEGLRAGAFTPVEHAIVNRVLDMDHRVVRDIMTPRGKVIWMELGDGPETIWHKIVVSNHSYFPVREDLSSGDVAVGVVSLKSIYANLAAGAGASLRDLSVVPLWVDASLPMPRLLELFKQAGRHVAFVREKPGGALAGLVTLNDVMEALVGEIASGRVARKPTVSRREDGSWIADGTIPLRELEEALPGFVVSTGVWAPSMTLAGAAVRRLGRVPREGDFFDMPGYRCEILDMDQQHIDKVLLVAAGHGGA